MQSPDRRLLLDRVVDLVEHLYDTNALGAAGEPGGTANLRVQLAPLLDRHLLESQAAVETDVTILLADIRGFTALTRSLPAPVLIRLLNRYFDAACEVIARHHGIIDKFMGDSVMALFGVPRQRPDDLQRALACAVELQQVMVAMNRSRSTPDDPELYAGIAINSGRVMAGSFGSARHREFTVIGEPVNLVSRIEGFSLRGQVLLSESSRTRAAGLIEVGNVNHVRVKGMPEPIALYELTAVQGGSGRLVVPRVEPRKSPRIAVDLDAMFRQIEAKRVRSDQIPGHVNDMGYYGMRADLPLGLPACSEVVMNLSAAAGPAAEEVYARVLRAQPHGSGFRTSMEFTAIDTPGHRRVKQLVDELLWRR